MNIEKWINKNTHDLTGKIIAVTGSTGCIAKFLINTLARLNANLILINRNKEKTNKQISEIKSINPNIEVEFVKCDLENFVSVINAVEILKQKKIDVLFLAAGAYNIPRFKTTLNYDNVFQINFLSQYYIARELLNTLKTSNGKIVVTSSIAHNYSKIDTNDIDFSLRKQHSKVYGNAKRFLTFSLMELCKNENVCLSIVHPGITLTEMTNHYPKAINWLVKIIIGTIFPKPKTASLNFIKGVFENTCYHEWIGPSFLQIYGKPTKIKLKTCTNEESEMIFKTAESIYQSIKK